MTPWLLQRLAFEPIAYTHKPEASFVFKTEAEAIQEFAHQFAAGPHKCTGKIFVISNTERTTRRFWIAADLRITDLEASDAERIIVHGFQTTRFQTDLRDFPAFVTTVAVLTSNDPGRVMFGAASFEDAKDRAALLCMDNFVRIEIFDRRSFRPLGKVTMTDEGPVFTSARTPDAQPAPIRPRQVDEILKYATLQGQALA